MEKSKRGRPPKESALPVADRVRVYRQRQRAERTRIDGYISSSASWRLSALADAWGCSRAATIERLIMEADDRYRSRGKRAGTIYPRPAPKRPGRPMVHDLPPDRAEGSAENENQAEVCRI